MRNVKDMIQRETTKRLTDTNRRVVDMETKEPGSGYVSLTGNQTVAGVKTFSDGIAFANETLSTYDEGTWSPAITGSVSNPTTLTYDVQLGQYTQIGNVMFYNFRLDINTITGGSGNIQISLPTTLPSGSGKSASAAVRIAGVDVTGTPYNAVFVPIAASAFGRIQTNVDNAAQTIEQISTLAAGDSISATGFYFTT